MPRTFATFRDGQAAAKMLAKELNTTTCLKRSRSGEWLVFDAIESAPIRNEVSTRLPKGSPENTREVEEHFARMDEHEFYNEEYYREQRLFSEGTHEEYIRYLYR